MVAPYYDDGACVIYHGDCMDMLSALSDVDLVVTSPPYNLGTKCGGPSGMHVGSLAARSLAAGYQEYDDAMDQDAYDKWQTAAVAAMWGTLSVTGAIFYNHKPRIQDGRAILPTQYGGSLPLRQIVVWNRRTGLNFSESFYLPKSEWIVIWAKPSWRLSSRAASSIGDVWEFPPERADDHPAPFPVGLPARAIDTARPRLVLDPFMGSGTTLRAAADAGVPAIGIERSERYCEIAAKRLAQGVLDFGGNI
jgi:modification methylase